jgi:hypothetical protein
MRICGPLNTHMFLPLGGWMVGVKICVYVSRVSPLVIEGIDLEDRVKSNPSMEQESARMDMPLPST